MIRTRPSLSVIPVVVWMTSAACSTNADKPVPLAPPPTTRLSPVAERLHGVDIIDNYRWLEGDTAEVSAWTDAQNRYTRSVLDALPGRRALEDRLRPLVQIGSVTAPIVRGNRYFFARRTGQPRPAGHLHAGGALGADHVIVDPMSSDAATRPAVTWLSPSSDGKLLAYGDYRRAEGATRLRLLEVDTAKLIPFGDAHVAEPV